MARPVGARTSRSGGVAAGGVPILEVRNVSKAFPGQIALDHVDLTLAPGTVHALVGKNGSGKSTLTKILAGYHKPEPGATALVDGVAIELGSRRAAEAAGMRFIHQDGGLIESLSTIDNLALGYGYKSRWWISRSEENRSAETLLREFGLEIDPRRPVRELSAVERSIIAIARALRGTLSGHPPRVLILDEPTESLHQSEVERLFDSIRLACTRGTAVLYISHRLDEVLSIAHEVTVLRDGTVVAHEPVAGLDHDRLIELIVGQPLDRLHHQEHVPSRDPILRCRKLTGRVCRAIDLAVHQGEILGIAGLVGSGRDELCYLLTGAQLPSAGDVIIGERVYAHLSPREALRQGVVFVPADRAQESAVPSLTIRENISLPAIESTRRLRWIRIARERGAIRRWMERTDVQPRDPEQLFTTLSGGNQQKAVIAKALRCEPKVIVLDEPVHGVDVSSRAMIYQMLLDAAAAGTAVVVAATDPAELEAVCDRVLVLCDGEVAATLYGADMNSSRIVGESMRSASNEAA